MATSSLGHITVEKRFTKKRGKMFLQSIAVRGRSVLVLFKKERGIVVSYCPLLDLASQGGTQKESEKNLRKAIDLFFHSVIERGTLEEALQELELQPSRFESDKQKKINIELPSIHAPAYSPAVAQAR